jgi:hypothetical protein
VSQLQLDLLREAVSAAKQKSDFYKQRLSRLPDFFTVEEFSCVPPLLRSEFATLSFEILKSGPKPPSLLGLTSGTTMFSAATADILFKPIEDQELQATRLIIKRLRGLEGPKSPLSLRLINANHGLDFAGPHEGIFALPLELPYHFQAVKKLLGCHFCYEGYSDRIVRLISPLNTLKTLTILLSEGNANSSEYGIHEIFCYAWRLSPFWQAQLHDFWNVNVHDIYAVSEVPGLQASRCQVCKGFHFSSACYVEFSPLLITTSSLGLVELIATSFPPLAGMMPVIRYQTDDIFRVGELCPLTRSTSYILAGRKKDLFIFDSARQVGSAGEISEVLDGFETVQRANDSRSSSLGVLAPIGLPIFTYEVDYSGVLWISIRVSFNVSLYLRKARTLEDEILANLVTLWTSLNGLPPSEGSIRVTAVNDSSLRPTVVKL